MIPLRVGDQSTTDCPSCNAPTARRKIALRCLECGQGFTYRPRHDNPRPTPDWSCPGCQSLNTRPEREP
jgi:hypothetical protein